MPKLTAKAKLDRVTKNKYRFVECNEDGSEMEYKEQKMGLIYFPKSIFEDAEPPEFVNVEINITT